MPWSGPSRGARPRHRSFSMPPMATEEMGHGEATAEGGGVTVPGWATEGNRAAGPAGANGARSCRPAPVARRTGHARARLTVRWHVGPSGGRPDLRPGIWDLVPRDPAGDRGQDGPDQGARLVCRHHREHRFGPVVASADRGAVCRVAATSGAGVAVGRLAATACDGVAGARRDAGPTSLNRRSGDRPDRNRTGRVPFLKTPMGRVGRSPHRYCRAPSVRPLSGNDPPARRSVVWGAVP